MNAKQVNELLSKYYYDLDSPAAYSGVDKLYQFVNANEKKIGRHRIRRWLNSQDSYSLQKAPRRSFKRLRVYTTGISNLWDADLIDVKNISQENDGVKYILVVIDVFSRYLWLQPLRDKTGDEVAIAFKTIFREKKPEKLRTDKG